MALSPTITLADVRGGMNNTDEPQSLSDDQVADARNIDWMQGTLGGKRSGCQSITIDGSVLNRVVPAMVQAKVGGASATNTANVTVDPTTDDGTGVTFHYVIVKVNTKPNTAISTMTLNGVALTQVAVSTFAGAGRLDVWAKSGAALANGLLTVTWAGVVDASIIVEVWQRVDQLSGSTIFTGTDNAPVGTFTTDPTFVVTDAVVFTTGTITNGNFQTVTGNTATATGRLAASYEIGRKPITYMSWTLSGATDWMLFTMTVRGALRSSVPTIGFNFLALMRHQPTNNLSEDELWMVDVAGRIDRRVGGSWQFGVPMISEYPGIFDATGFDVNGVSLHGKFFLASQTSVAGLMVWDGTALRFAGFPLMPGPPTVANTGGAGSYIATRYFRYRHTAQVAGVTVRRSEPTASVSFVPSGTNTGAVITKVAGTEGFQSQYMNGQTHWEVEASLDNTLFYRIATVVIGTATYTDTTANTVGYSANPLSEQIGEYAAPVQPRHLAVDEDRLIMAGHRGVPGLDSRVTWTPVANATGVGNDERVPSTTANFLDLDNLSGGNIQMLIAGESGNIYAFKLERIYKLTRTGILTAAYAPQTESKSRGSTKRAAVSGHDQFGTPCVYFTDASVGLCRISKNGIERLGEDVQSTWETVTLGGPSLGPGPRMFYWAAKQQVWVMFPISPSQAATKFLIFNTRFGSAEGKGYAIYESPLMTSGIHEGVMFPNTTLELLPHVGMVDPPLVKFTTTDVNDAGNRYRAYWLSKAYLLGQTFTKFGVMAGVLFARASTTTIGVALLKNLGVGRKDVTISIAPAISETHVFKPIDDAFMSECFTVQFELGDPSSYTGAQLDQTWSLNQYAAKLRAEDEGTS